MWIGISYLPATLYKSKGTNVRLTRTSHEYLSPTLCTWSGGCIFQIGDPNTSGRNPWLALENHPSSEASFPTNWHW